MVEDLNFATFYSLVVLYAFAFVLGVFIVLLIIFICAVIMPDVVRSECTRLKPNTKVYYRRCQVRTLETTTV
jgi:hypothetical protein